MKNLSIAGINTFWQKANNAATKQENHLRKKARLEVVRNEHYIKNEQAYRMATLGKIICMLMIFPFLMAGVYEGIIVAPIFEGAYLQGLTDNEFWRRVASYLPMATLLGLSLATGLCFHNISAKADPVVPNKKHITWHWVAGACIGLGLYIGCLYFLTRMASEAIKGEGMEAALSLIPVWGGIEIFVGIFAARGVEVLWVHSIGLVLGWANRSVESSIIRYTQQCIENYHYYQQMLRQWNQVQQPEMEENLTPAIKGVLYKNASRMEEVQRH